MQVRLCVVGRMRAGPEATLVSEYVARFDRTGRALGLGPLEIVEVEDRKGGGMEAEASLLRRALPRGALVCCLDERGRSEPSPAFAARLAGWRDTGRGPVCFVIGGADGIAPDLRADADHLLSLGQMVWPHMLARVMLVEQLYRAASILSGGPYHRV